MLWNFWELVDPNCRQGSCHTDTVSTPAAAEMSMPVISEDSSSELLPAESLRRNGDRDGGGGDRGEGEDDPNILLDVWHWLSPKRCTVLVLSVNVIFVLVLARLQWKAFWHDTRTLGGGGGGGLEGGHVRARWNMLDLFYTWPLWFIQMRQVRRGLIAKCVSWPQFNWGYIHTTVFSTL